MAVAVLTPLAGCGEEPKPAKKIVPRETINKTTQNVLDLKAEMAKGGGGQKTDNKVKESDYLTVVTDARRKALGDISKMAVQQRIGMYEALNGEKPKTYEEFMEHIIGKGKPDGMQLPMLPYYQEYAYDSDAKELVILEYPEKKKAYEKQEGIR
jgi:hypothetical protein